MDRARNLLREFAVENTSFTRQHDFKYFKPFVDAQKPRATLITCSDSRVQSPAFDPTPDNDLFTIRNIGNQIATSEGSVEYGIEHLKTPLLFILGHTGCGAVKAALGDFSSQPEPIRRELATLDLSAIGNAKADRPEKSDRGDRGERPDREARPAERRSDGDKGRAVSDQAWLDGVIANVHHQVASALAMFSAQVSDRDLIVVGAVYDLRNDLRKGHGTLHVVNVNGHSEPAKIAAFMRALEPKTGDATEPRGGAFVVGRRSSSSAQEPRSGR